MSNLGRLPILIKKHLTKTRVVEFQVGSSLSTNHKATELLASTSSLFDLSLATKVSISQSQHR